MTADSRFDFKAWTPALGLDATQMLFIGHKTICIPLLSLPKDGPRATAVIKLKCLSDNLPSTSGWLIDRLLLVGFAKLLRARLCPDTLPLPETSGPRQH